MWRPAMMDELIAQELLCPISQELLTVPVLAEDGHIYDRSRIEQWLERSRTSPITRARMGTTLRPVPVLARIVDLLVARGALDDDLQESWRDARRDAIEAQLSDAIRKRDTAECRAALQSGARATRKSLSAYFDGCEVGLI